MADQPFTLYGATQPQVFTSGGALAAIRVDATGHLEVTVAPGVLWPCDLHWVAGVHIYPVPPINGTVYTAVPIMGTAQYYTAGALSPAVGSGYLDVRDAVIAQIVEANFAGAAAGDTLALTATLNRRLRVNSDMALIAGNAPASAGVNGMLAVGGDVAVAAAPSASHPVKIGGQSTNAATVWGGSVVPATIETLRVDTRRRLWTYAEGPGLDGDLSDPQWAPLKLGVISDETLVQVADDRIIQLVADRFRRLRTLPEGADADGTLEGLTMPVPPNPLKVGGVAFTDAALAAAPVVDGAIAKFATDLFRRLRTLPEGPVADGVAATTFNPLKLGAVVDQVLTALADGQMAQLVTDIYRRLWVVTAGYDSVADAVRGEVNTIADDRDESAQIWAADTNVGAGTTYYPSSAGYEVGNRDHLTLMLVMTDNTTTIEASNDGTTWLDITNSVLDLNTGAAFNATFPTGAALSKNWLLDMERANARYVRAAVVTPDATNAASIKVMTRKA